MDAKYNWIIDNFGVRVAINTVAFALWLALTVGVLEVCARL
jgi:hypothetical protein